MNAIKYLLLALLAHPLAGFGETYTLTLQRVPQQGGTVSGGGTYEAGTEKPLKASINTGYIFLGWYDEGDNLISSSTSITYTIPEHDVTLTARFLYDPTVPDEPQVPGEEAPLYHVDFATSPPNTGSIYTAPCDMAAGSTLSVSYYPPWNFTFVEWRNDLGEVVSTNSSFTYTVPERDSRLTAYVTYEAELPDIPGSLNGWDPFTGELVILKVNSSLQSSCDALLTTDERALVKKLVVADPDFSSSISYIRSYLTGVEVVDLHKTKYVSYGSNNFAISTLKKLMLPAGSLSFSSSTFSSSSNAALEEIWVYATTPPRSGASCLNNVPADCIIYVPNESLEEYYAATYWKDHDIRPMESEENAVGPEDAEWNDLSLLHKIPFSYTYTGTDGGRIEYMVEEDGVWKALSTGVASGTTVSANALAQFDKGRRVHTIDFRVVDGTDVTALSDKRVELTDLGFKALTVAGPNCYNYGEAIEPALTVADLEPDKYVIVYSNNLHVGRATVHVGGVYPHTIGYRSTTFDISALPLPGSVEFSDGEVSLIYCNENIRPAWRFTDPRNEGLVANTDYTVSWSNTCNAGTASLVVTGKGQFTGSITYEYEIAKGPVLPSAYTYGFDYPAEEIIYDGSSHGFYTRYSYNPALSGPRIYEYYDQETGEKLPSAPSDMGLYEAWIGFDEGPNTVYTAPECRRVFAIFDMDDSEWAALQTLSGELAERGYTTGWDFGAKINSLRFSGVSVKNGRLTEVNLPSKGMTGTFPASLYTFGSLKRLCLQGNRLSGTFDDETRTIAAVEYADFTGNLFSGDLTALAGRFPAITTLKVSGNRLSSVTGALPGSLVTLEAGGQQTGATVPLDFTGLSLQDFYESIPGIARYDHSTGTFATAPDLWLTTSDYKTVSQLAGSTWAMKLTGEGVEKVSGNVVFAESNGSVVHVLTADNDWFDVTFTFLAGDTDFDRVVSVLDLQGAINCIFMEVSSDAPFNRTAADVKADGAVNVFDVASIVQLLMAVPAPAVAALRYAASPDPQALAYCSGGTLMISSAEPVAAFDITLAGGTLPKRIPQLDEAGFSYSVSGSHIVGYSLSGATLPAGVNEIATTGEGSVVTCVTLANSRAKAITESAITPSGLDETAIDENDTAPWYNLQGLRIARPSAPGIYIHNNQKIIIR